jgi:regulator of sigma E protease
MFQGIFVFIIFLGPLIFFHELGHFLFARLCGVRVETFSIGFGPKLFKFTRGDTNYAISLIPLGGYVKMFGDDPTTSDEVPEEDRKFAFTHKSKWQRFSIVVGGPFANFLLAYIIYYFLLIAGQSVPQVKFGVIDDNTSFYSSGLRTGDVLTKLNTHEVSSLEDISVSEDKISSITIERAKKEVILTTDIFSKTFIESFLALDQFLRKPIIVNGKGQKFGLALSPKFDEKVSIEEIIATRPEQVFLIPVKEEAAKIIATSDKAISINVDKENVFKSMRSSFYYPIDMMVDGLIVDAPADKAKIKKGDILLAINGENLYGFNRLRTKIQTLAKDKKELTLKYLRDAKTFETKLAPEKKEHNGKEYFAIGIYSSAQVVGREMVNSKPRGIIESFALALKKTYEGSASVLMGFKKLVTGAASMKNLGGPIAIAKQASYSLDVSLSYFFKLMALISINLGVLNLLPIPILDGGHILFILVEVVTGGPVPRKIMMIAQQFGLSLLLLLMIFAIGNDISRFFQ